MVWVNFWCSEENVFRLHGLGQILTVLVFLGLFFLFLFLFLCEYFPFVFSPLFCCLLFYFDLVIQI